MNMGGKSVYVFVKSFLLFWLFVFFCFLGEGASFWCCLGGWRVFFVLLFGVHSLTGLPGSSLRGPTTKQTKQQEQKKKTRFRT